MVRRVMFVVFSFNILLKYGHHEAWTISALGFTHSICLRSVFGIFPRNLLMRKKESSNTLSSRLPTKNES